MTIQMGLATLEPAAMNVQCLRYLFGNCVLLAALIAALVIIYKHRSNIDRLRAGTENVFVFGKKA